MSLYSPSIEKLIESFERLPSIGHKTAARLAFYILNSTDEETKQFVNSIIDAKKNLKYWKYFDACLHYTALALFFRCETKIFLVLQLIMERATTMRR